MGRIASICAGTPAGCALMEEAYAWDDAGNLATHLKESRSLEVFTYDALDRLTLAKLTMHDQRGRR